MNRFLKGIATALIFNGIAQASIDNEYSDFSKEHIQKLAKGEMRVDDFVKTINTQITTIQKKSKCKTHVSKKLKREVAKHITLLRESFFEPIKTHSVNPALFQQALMVEDIDSQTKKIMIHLKNKAAELEKLIPLTRLFKEGLEENKILKLQLASQEILISQLIQSDARKSSSVNSLTQSNTELVQNLSKNDSTIEQLTYALNAQTNLSLELQKDKLNLSKELAALELQRLRSNALIAQYESAITESLLQKGFRKSAL